MRGSAHWGVTQGAFSRAVTEVSARAGTCAQLGACVHTGRYGLQCGVVNGSHGALTVECMC